MKNVTLKHLYSMCDDIGDRWMWRGRTNGAGTPKMIYRQVDTSVYRVAYCLHHKLELSDLGKDVIWPVTEQGDINPQHLMRGTAGQLQTWRKLNGKSKRSPSARAAHTRGARTSPHTKLSIEKAREVRASDEHSTVLAARFGVDRKAIEDIRRGRTWRETVGPASIFSMGRGA